MLIDMIATGGEHAAYVYTADDERIAVLNVVSSTAYEGTWRLRGLDNKVVREYHESNGASQSWSWSRDYVYRGGLLLSSYLSAPGGTEKRYDYHLDHLGTPRLITDAAGRKISAHNDYPFGAEITWTDVMAETMTFTGHERDLSATATGPNRDYWYYMHARYDSPNLGRFLSVDPVIPKAAIRSPQLWNRYSYVGNNPIARVDPDGRLLQLSGCVENTMSPACRQQASLFLSTFGKQAQEAGKYLQVGKNGIVSFKGISGSAFAAKFGLMGAASNFLMSNRAATFSLVTGASGKTAAAGGSYFDPRAGGGGEIGINPNAFPVERGMVNQSAAEALAHEIGHAVGSLIPGVQDAVDARLGGAATKTPWTTHEGYSMAFENRWRYEVLGVERNDLRMFYRVPTDVLHNLDIRLFP
jgi:RHS repeat-associated protein